MSEPRGGLVVMGEAGTAAMLSPDRRWELLDREDGLVCRLHGEITDSVDEDFSVQVIDRIVSHPGRFFMLDFSGCQNLASIALGTLMQFQCRATAVEKDVYWTGARGQVDNVIRVLGMHRIMRKVSPSSALRRSLGS